MLCNFLAQPFICQGFQCRSVDSLAMSAIGSAALFIGPCPGFFCQSQPLTLSSVLFCLPLRLQHSGFLTALRFNCRALSSNLRFGGFSLYLRQRLRRLLLGSRLSFKCNARFPLCLFTSRLLSSCALPLRLLCCANGLFLGAYFSLATFDLGNAGGFCFSLCALFRLHSLALNASLLFLPSCERCAHFVL